MRPTRSLKAVYKKLKYHELKIRSLCHHKNCNSIKGCPTEHYLCSNDLNYFTSLLWSLADEIKLLESIIIDPYFHKGQVLIRKITIRTITEIFYRHSHKCPKHKQIVIAAVNYVNNLLSYLKTSSIPFHDYKTILERKRVFRP